MGNKSGHCRFVQLRRALHFGVQLFEGYPHRRHHKKAYQEKTQRSKIVEKIREQEFDEELKKLDKHLKQDL